jgi:hypothetical protein
MGRRLVLLAFAAVVATVGIDFVISGLRNSSQSRFLFGVVLTLAAACWSAVVSRSRPQ